MKSGAWLVIASSQWTITAWLCGSVLNEADCHGCWTSTTLLTWSYRRCLRQVKCEEPLKSRVRWAAQTTRVLPFPRRVYLHFDSHTTGGYFCTFAHQVDSPPPIICLPACWLDDFLIFLRFNSLIIFVSSTSNSSFACAKCFDCYRHIFPLLFLQYFHMNYFTVYTFSCYFCCEIKLL